jgi:hypothetical protein
VVPLGFGLSARVGDAEVFDACTQEAKHEDFHNIGKRLRGTIKGK